MPLLLHIHSSITSAIKSWQLLAMLNNKLNNSSTDQLPLVFVTFSKTSANASALSSSLVLLIL
jgi:hypothetical protein